MNPEFNFTQQEIEEGKTLAGVAYITLVGFIVALIAGKDNRFTMYHVQQSLVLILLGVAAGLVGWIPFLGWLIVLAVFFFGIVCFIMGMINGFTGQVKPLPLIGPLGFKFNLVKPTSGGSSTAAGTGTNPPPSA